MPAGLCHVWMDLEVGKARMELRAEENVRGQASEHTLERGRLERCDDPPPTSPPCLPPRNATSRGAMEEEEVGIGPW